MTEPGDFFGAHRRRVSVSHCGTAEGEADEIQSLISRRLLSIAILGLDCEGVVVHIAAMK